MNVRAVMRYFTDKDGIRVLELDRVFDTYRVIDRSHGKMRQSKYDSLQDAMRAFDAKADKVLSL